MGTQGKHNTKCPYTTINVVYTTITQKRVCGGVAKIPWSLSSAAFQKPNIIVNIQKNEEKKKEQLTKSIV